MTSHYCDGCGHPAGEHLMGTSTCTGQTTDLFGTWACDCAHFERDPDDD